MERANWLPAPAIFNLNHACSPLVAAFGQRIYLVGSCLDRRDYRDVDVRCILDDAEYERLFPGLSGNAQPCALWSVMCASISLYLSQQTGLPIDFQIQKQSEANEKFDGKRSALALWLNYAGGR